MPIEEDYDFLFKTVIVGDSNVGKTQILSRFMNDQFTHDSKPTVGVEFGTKTIKLGEVWVKNQIWDTAGQEKFRALTSAYYRGAVGAIIVFDLSKNVTFQHVEQWIKEVKQYSEEDATILLVGNKNDLEQHQVTTEDIENFATDHKLLYISTSAATGQNVQLAFEMLVKQIMGTVDPDPQKNLHISDDEDEPDVSHPPVEKKHNQKSDEKITSNKQQTAPQPSILRIQVKPKPPKGQKPKMQAFSIEEGNKQTNVKIGQEKSNTVKPKKKCC